MNLYIKQIALTAVLILVAVFQVSAAGTSALDFELPDIDGNNVALTQYKGNVILLVNVASKCGLTPQYKGLQKIYAQYKDRGFTILAFPANNFRDQEPGSNADIKEFCSKNFNVSFPMFSKISVLGDDMHPLYKFLTSKESNPGFEGDIRWNFDKFLIDTEGKVIARFHPKTTPVDESVTTAIETALKKK